MVEPGDTVRGATRLTHGNDNRGCWHKRYTPDGCPIPCRSRRCPSAWCRRKHAEKQSAILGRSFANRPPDYCLTLRLDDDLHTSDRMMRSYLKAFTQRVRDHRKATGEEIEYDGRLEFCRYGQPHLHLTLIGGPGRLSPTRTASPPSPRPRSCRGRRSR